MFPRNAAFPKGRGRPPSAFGQLRNQRSEERNPCFGRQPQSLFDALGQTAEIFFLTLLFGLPLGLVVAFGSMSKWQPFRFLLQPKKRKDSGTSTAETDLAPVKQEPSKFIKALAAFRPIHTITDVVVWVIRGTPLMLQLIIIFYGPGMWFDNNIWGGNRMAACVVAFVINYACYFSVIYRGIQGVPWASGRPPRSWASPGGRSSSRSPCCR